MANRITERIDSFFNGQDIVWVIPGSDGHSSNFYGHEEIIEITRDDVRNLVQCAMEGVVFEDEALSRSEQEMIVLEGILRDLQHDAPELSVEDQILELEEIVNSNQTDKNVTLETMLQDWANVSDALIDARGNCWAGDWLTEDQTVEFIEWVKSNE